jgi:hypothetical protein
MPALKHLKFIAGRTFMVVVLAVTGVVAMGSWANAAKDCLFNVKYSGDVIAQVCASWYDGTDHVTLESRGSHYGVSKKMYLKACHTWGGGPDYCKTDSGTFKYYAGPLNVVACREFTVKIWKPGSSTTVLVNKTYVESCN